MSEDNHKILIVCSDSQMINLIAKALCLKYPTTKLFFSNSIDDCVSKCKQNCFDIAIAIPREPVWNVGKLIHNVKLSNQLCRILLASQYSSGIIITEYLSLGVWDIIGTPLNLDLLLNKITALMGDHSANSN